jgi:predicted metal-binding transcription factor (methanogenesis marker protein 9)
MVKRKIEDINKILQAFEEHKKSKEEEIVEIQNKIDIIKKFKDREPPFTEEESKSILSLTCYGNVGYCCGLLKGCPYRDTALGLFKITADEYEKTKNDYQTQLLKDKRKP